MVACRVSETRIGDRFSQMPLKRNGENRISAMRMYSSNSPNIFSLFNQVTNCLSSLENSIKSLSLKDREIEKNYEPDYSDCRRRQLPMKRSLFTSRLKLHMEYPSQPGHRGLITRSKEGKFILDDTEDEGGFAIDLPNNRFRTRSMAIVSSYSPERLYSNMPQGASVVESGMYQVGASRSHHQRPEPIYWKQVVYGSSDNYLTKQQITRAIEDNKNMHFFEKNNDTKFDFENQDSSRNMRASSPLNQEMPLIEWLSPINNYSDLSSVTHKERSLPSTLLSTLLSPTLSSNIEPKKAEGSFIIPTKRLHQKSVPTRESTGKGTTSYQNADIIFPNYALNYPAPIHTGGNISPSRQYPTTVSHFNENNFIRGHIESPGEKICSNADDMPHYENMASPVGLKKSKQDCPVNERLDEEVRALTNSSSESFQTLTKNDKQNQSLLEKVNIKSNLKAQPFYENWPTINPDTKVDSNTSSPSRQGSGSVQSAPVHDVSIDLHYEFDTRSPIDDLNLHNISEALPKQWNRPYLGYNPRQREGNIGEVAQLAKSERVFSDSEIYSPVFPRGKPNLPAKEDIIARVKEMKREFEEYRESKKNRKSSGERDEVENEAIKLESLI